MQDVIGAFPFKLLFRKQVQIACRRLVKVDHAKRDIECPDVIVVMGGDHHPDQSKDNVKYVIGRSCRWSGSFYQG